MALKFAMLAADLEPILEAEAKERQGARTDIEEKIPESSKGRARDKAAIVGVNPRYVSDAKKIKEESSPRADEAKQRQKLDNASKQKNC